MQTHTNKKEGLLNSRSVITETIKDTFITKDINEKISRWLKQRRIDREPTAAEIELILQQAQNDRFQGTIILVEKKEKVLAYQPSRDIKWNGNIGQYPPIIKTELVGDIISVGRQLLPVIKADPTADINNLRGIWKGRKINKKILRKLAWGDRV